MTKYLLDANVFIQAKNLYYRFETFPGFWEWLDIEQKNGNLATTTLVYDELLRGNDELADWIKLRKSSGWFLPESDEPTQIELAEINNWVMDHRQYKDTAKEDFLSGADTWLIAKASVLGATVVTHEGSSPESKNKIFIPDVCKQFEVPYIDVFALLSQLKASFGL